MTGKTYNINFGKGKLEAIEVDSKNNLPIGTVLHLYGYDEPEFVIVKNLGVHEKFKNYGARYQTVRIDTYTQRTHDAMSLSWPEDGRKGIHTEITSRVLSKEETTDIWEKSEELRKTAELKQADAERKYAELVEKGKVLFEKYIPEDTKALIVAERHIDESDPMNDYYHASTAETIILAWSKHTKDLFSEMRKAALKIPETEHLGTGKGHFEPYVSIDETIQSNGSYYHKGSPSHWHSELDGGYNRSVFPTLEEARAFIDKQGDPEPISFDGQAVSFSWAINEESIEHREKYSMGNGYYLKDGHSTSNGWCVRKLQKWQGNWSDGLKASLAKRCVFDDQISQSKINEEPQKQEGVAIGSYKGKPTISLPMDGKRSFTFGKAKAKAIIDNIDAIRDFALK